jgi:hypothetical protein
MIRHTAVTSCWLSLRSAQPTAGIVSAQLLSDCEARLNVIGRALTDSVRHEGNSRLKEVGMWGELGWSGFVEEALATTPIRSMLALPLFTREFPRSVLSLYGDRPAVFGVKDEHIALAFVVDASTAVETWRREQRFRRALINRGTIGQAKGILTESFDIDAVAAFSLPSELSKNRGQSVSSVARGLLRRKLVDHGGKRLQS